MRLARGKGALLLGVSALVASGCHRAQPPPAQPLPPAPVYYYPPPPPGYYYPPPPPSPAYYPPPPAPPPAPPPPPAGFSAAEVRVLDLINRARARGASCGGTSYPPAPPLAMDALLTQASRLHSADMGHRRYFDHESPDGRGPGERAAAVGYRSRGLAENIAAGSDTPEGAVDQWMKSAGHCENIMTAKYRVMGIGYASAAGSPYTHYWTQMFGM